MKEVKDKMKEIERKQAQAVTLRQQVERSLAIQELWPGVFDAGAKVAGVWKGDKDGITFTIKSSGAERVFPLSRVPECLRATMPTELVLRVQEHDRKQSLIFHYKRGVSA